MKDSSKVRINFRKHVKPIVSLIFVYTILSTLFIYSYCFITYENSFNGMYKPSRVCAISDVRIWFTDTTSNNITASKWFPSNATENDNHTQNFDFKEKFLHDVQEIELIENFQVLCFNWSTAISWSLGGSYKYNNLNTVNLSPLYDINNEIYLNYTEIVTSSLILSNCSFLSYKYNGTVLGAYERAMEDEDYSTANNLIPEAAKKDEYISNKPFPAVYAVNVSIQRLARSLESLWYIDHVDVFYDYDGTRDTYGQTNPSFIEKILGNWGLLVISVIPIILISLFVVKIKK